MRTRWFELGRIDKGVSVIGLGFGVLWILSVAFLISIGLTSSQGGSSPDFAGAVLFLAIFSSPFLFSFLSALSLMILPLKNEQRGILSFISLIASIIAAIPVFFVLFAVYCSATHSICS